jgi:serine/threonine protein kinase
MLNDEIEIYKALESKGFNDNIVKRVTVTKLEFNQVDINILDISVYLPLEYCDMTLTKFVAETESYDITDVIKQIFSGLLFLYYNNILHLDLKPDNILVKKEGAKYKFKISDFGTAKIYNDIKEACNNNVKHGTLCYAPSDESLKNTTFFRDLYSFYCIIYFLCYNRHYNYNNPENRLLIANINIATLDNSIIKSLIELQSKLIKRRELVLQNNSNKMLINKNTKNNKNKNKILPTQVLYSKCYINIIMGLHTLDTIDSKSIDKSISNLTSVNIATFDARS